MPQLNTQQPPVTAVDPSLTTDPQASARPALNTVNLDQKGSRPPENSRLMKKKSKMVYSLMVVAVVAGIGTGFGLQKLSAKSGNPISGSSGTPISQVAGSNVKEGDVFGSQNEDDFKDTAEGYLEKGGIEEEGSHKLLREGGDSQTVYLTSSVTDLDKFEGMEIKVWGETYKAQKAGWLMDVGRVKVIKVEGEMPTEE